MIVSRGNVKDAGTLLNERDAENDRWGERDKNKKKGRARESPWIEKVHCVGCLSLKILTVSSIM